MSSTFFSASGFACSLLAMTTAVQAVPLDIFRRMEVNYVDCSNTRKTKLQQAFADAAVLANHAYDIDQSSKAFTQYLRDEDADNAKSLFSMVAANNDPTNAPYTFSVRCAKTCTGGEKDSLAVTDAAPQDGDALREMKICPLFFNYAGTKNTLSSKPFDGDKDGSWCKSGQHFADFETGGHTLLHEMTHLDALARAAGLPENTRDGITTHGTDDVDGFGDDYISSARELLDTWVNHPDELDPAALKPYQNAENIAAAATEYYFTKKCGFVEIDL